MILSGSQVSGIRKIAGGEIRTTTETEQEKRFIPLDSRTGISYTRKELNEMHRRAAEAGPWKCKYCNIMFGEREEVIEHLWKTGFRCGGEKGVYFHVVVDRDGDDVMYLKEIHN